DALRIAAEKAERREGLQEADRLYARALEIVGDEHAATAAELCLRRARILAALGSLDESCERFRAAAAEGECLGWANWRGAAQVGLGNALKELGRGEEARVALVDAHAIAEETFDARLEVLALFELAEVKRDFSGETDAAVMDLERALELAA